MQSAVSVIYSEQDIEPAAYFPWVALLINRAHAETQFLLSLTTFYYSPISPTSFVCELNGL